MIRGTWRLAQPGAKVQCFALVLTLVLGGSVAAQQGPVVTVDKPATVSVLPSKAAPPSKEKRKITVEVIAYDPPSSGTVQAVVSAGDKPGDIVGRFALFPNEKFKADSPKAAQRFQVTLDQEAAKRVMDSGKLTVDLKALSGSGQGARLELGRVLLAD